MLGSPATQGLYESPVVFGHRRPKNLRDMLVQGKVKLPQPVRDNPDTPFSKARGHAGLNDVILHILEFCQTPPDAAHRPHREKAEKMAVQIKE